MDTPGSNAFASPALSSSSVNSPPQNIVHEIFNVSATDPSVTALRIDNVFRYQQDLFISDAISIAGYSCFLATRSTTLKRSYGDRITRCDDWFHKRLIVSRVFLKIYIFLVHSVYKNMLGSPEPSIY